MANVTVPPSANHKLASIARWRVSDGAFVAVDDPIVDLNYGGEIVELAAGFEGLVARTYNYVGQVPFGTVLTTIDEYSMPGRPAPRLFDFGLSRDDAILLKSEQDRLERSVTWRIAVIGGLVGDAVLVLGIDAKPSLGWTVIWLACGLFFGFMVGAGTAESVSALILRITDKRFNSLRRFEHERRVFGQLIKTEWEHDRRSQEDFWRGLTGHQFESELASLLSRSGFQAERTKGSGDQGIDINVTQGRKKIIVQCKQTKNPVGPAVARELYGTLQGCAADEAWLAATAGVTRGVTSFFHGKPLRVVTLSEIVSWSMEANRRRAREVKP